MKTAKQKSRGIETPARVGLAILLACASVAVAAVPLSLDPSGAIYRDLDEWEVRGLVEPAFMLRPYPPALVAEMLELAAARGTDSDRQRAMAWLRELKKPRPVITVLSDSRATASADDSSYSGDHGAEALMNAELAPWLWAGGKVGVFVQASPATPGAPKGETTKRDIIYAGGTLSESGSQGTRFGLLVESAVYAGSARLWFGAGATRSSFGPFFDNGIVIGPQAPSAANFTLQGRFGAARFSMGLFELVRGGDVPQATNKHAVFHSVSFPVGSRLDLGVFETIVFTNRLEPAYFLPLGNYFLLQSMSDYGANSALGDNSLAGVYGSWRFAPGFRAKALVFIDDIHFDDIVRGKWDTKWTLAGQAGLEWAPGDSPLRRLSADYSLVMPYMYTHYYYRGDPNKSDNYQNNWTHYGKSWGAELLPNSDRLELRARLAPTEDVEIETLGRLMRHGNASAGVANADAAHDRPGDSQDGGLSDDGWFYDPVSGAYLPSYQGPYATGTSPLYARFLTQSVIETVVQGGVGVSWRPRLEGLGIELSARYLLELVWNETVAGLGPVAGKDSVRHYFGVTATVSR